MTRNAGQLDSTVLRDVCVGPIDVPFAPAGKPCSNTTAAAPLVYCEVNQSLHR